MEGPAIDDWEYVLKAGVDYADELEFGLDLMFDALEGARDAACCR